MDKKVLISYFIQKGKETSTSKRVADNIAAALKAQDVETTEFAITPVETYPEDKTEFEGIVKLEQKDRIRPAITSKVGKFDEYKTIVVVAPNWYGDAPMAVYTFFDEHDFGGKRIVPVICHAGDGGKEIRESFRKFMKCDVLDGVDGADSADDKAAVAEAVAEVVAK